MFVTLFQMTLRRSLYDTFGAPLSARSQPTLFPRSFFPLCPPPPLPPSPTPPSFCCSPPAQRARKAHANGETVLFSPFFSALLVAAKSLSEALVLSVSGRKWGERVAATLAYRRAIPSASVIVPIVEHERREVSVGEVALLHIPPGRGEKLDQVAGLPFLSAK